MSNAEDFFPDRLVLPSGVYSKNLKDSNGRCWKLQGFDDNVGNITSLPSGFEIEESYPCCEMCQTLGVVDELDLDEYIIDDESSSSDNESSDSESSDPDGEGGNSSSSSSSSSDSESSSSSSDSSPSSSDSSDSSPSSSSSSSGGPPADKVWQGAGYYCHITRYWGGQGCLGEPVPDPATPLCGNLPYPTGICNDYIFYSWQNVLLSFHDSDSTCGGSC